MGQHPGNSDPDEGFDDGLFVRGVTRYFISEDFLLQVEGAYGWVDEYTNGNQTGQIWNWGALGKIGLSDSMPIYGTLEYRGGYTESMAATPEPDPPMKMSS